MSSMPEELKILERRSRQLLEREEALIERADYEAAARLRADCIREEQEFNACRDAWLRERKLTNAVDHDAIARVVAQRTEIPVDRILESEAARLLHIEDSLHERIIGQEHPVAVVSEAIRRARSGLSDPKRPIGSFMFLGPTGVGKTELARALAEFLFDDEDAMVRVDMSEYMERHSASRLIGAPPGYIGYDEGGQLTEAVRRRPFRVLLLDEVEKAHPEVLNLLLQVLEDGRLTDGHGRTVDFRNTVIIMTSNLGTESLGRQHGMGFRRDVDLESERQEKMNAVEEALRKAFRPEFLNRLDEVVIFDSLTRQQILQVVNLMIRQVQERLGERGVEIVVTIGAREWLASTGFDALFGARPLRRAIQRFVENPLSSRILGGEFEPGSQVEIDVAGDGAKLTFGTLAKAEVAI